MENTKTYLEYKKNANEKFVRDEEGAEMYHMSLSKFMQIAKNAKAVYKIGHMVLMKFEFLDDSGLLLEYLQNREEKRASQ